MPSHIELVAGKHYQVRVIDPSPLCLFNHNIKLSLLELYMMKNLGSSKQIVTISYKSGIENPYYYYKIL
jgi:hypothetical protein